MEKIDLGRHVWQCDQRIKHTRPSKSKVHPISQVFCAEIPPSVWYWRLDSDESSCLFQVELKNKSLFPKKKSQGWLNILKKVRELIKIFLCTQPAGEG